MFVIFHGFLYHGSFAFLHYADLLRGFVYFTMVSSIWLGAGLLGGYYFFPVGREVQRGTLWHTYLWSTA